MDIISTQDYFNTSVDDLLATDKYTYTKEERLLFDDGLNVTFFDDIREYREEEVDFEKWYKEKGYEVKAILKTINERIAVVLI